MAALAGAAAALRFSTLGTQSLWSDESVTAALVHKGLGAMLRATAHTESTPPLYYVLAWLWCRVFGFGEAGLRSLSAAAGTAGVLLVYLAARSLGGRRAATAAGLLAAVNPLLVWYSQEARAYSLLVALAAATFVLFLRALERPAGPRLGAWALASTCALATHYYSAFLVAAEGAWLLRRHRSRATIAASGAVAVCGAALLPLALAQHRRNTDTHIAGSASLAHRLVLLVKEDLAGLDAPHDKLAALAVAAALVPAVAAAVRGGAHLRRTAALAAGIGAAAVVLAVVLALAGADYVNSQNLLPSLVALVAAAGVAVAAVRSLPLRVASLGVVAAASVALVVAVDRDVAYQRTDWRAVARAIDAGPGGARVVLAAPDYGGWYARLPLTRYLRGGVRAIDRGRVERTWQYRYLSGSRRDLPADRAVRVRELAIVTPGDTSRFRIPGGFAVVERRTIQDLHVTVLRSRAALAVTGASLVPADPASAAALLEQPG